MDVKTYRAKTMQEALALVRRELGPKASVLRTREVRGGGLLRWLGGTRLIEVVASTSVSVPSRLPPRIRAEESAPVAAPALGRAPIVPRQRSERTLETAPTPAPFAAYSTSRSVAHAAEQDMTHVTQVSAPVAAHAAARMHAHPAAVHPQADLQLTAQLQRQLKQLQSKVDDLCRRDAPAATRTELPESLFRLFADLIEADVHEDLARELIEGVRQSVSVDELADPARLRSALVRQVEEQIPIAGPIRLTEGRRHLVALVGPTGVGKTTTIAKLAANYRLREKRRVGLITVDTYRIAAVEQLRTYADIIDLPMEIVATPFEMHQALARLADLDVVLMDTAGRSPRDDVRIQELKSFLAEAAPDEVHLVQSSVSSAGSLVKTAEQFAAVGTTAMVLTKLDEAASLGNLLPVLRASGLPLSYLTHGQNVPDDIAPADGGRLARTILGHESMRNQAPEPAGGGRRF